MLRSLNRSPKSVILLFLSITLFISLLIPTLLYLSKQKEPLYIPIYEPQTITRQYDFIPFSNPLKNSQHEILLSLGALNHMDSTSDGKTIVTSSAYGIFVWNLQKNSSSPCLWNPIEDDRIESLILSSNGKKLAMGSSSGAVVVWDAHTWKQTLAMKPYVASIHSLAFSHDETVLAAVCSAGMVKLIDLQSAEIIKTLRIRTKDAISSVGFTSDDAQMLLSCNHSPQSYLLDIDSGQIRYTYHHNGDRNSFAQFMPNIQSVILGDNDYSFYLLDKDNIDTVEDFLGENSFSGHKREIRCLSVSPDGKCIVTSSVDGTTKFWDVRTRQEIASIGSYDTTTINTPNRWNAYNSFFYLRFIENGKRVLLGNHNGDVQTYELSTQKIETILTGHNPNLSTIAFSNDGEFLLQGGSDGSVRNLDLKTMEWKQTYWGHYDYVMDIAISPNQTTYASLDREGVILVRDMNTGETQYDIRPTYIMKGGDNQREDWFGSVAFSPDGKQLAAGDTYVESDKNGYFNEIKWFDATNGELKKIWKRHNDQITPQFSRKTSRYGIYMTFAPDMKNVLTSIGGKSLIWDIRTDEKTPGVAIGEGYGNPSSFSHDGRYVVLCGAKLEVWDIQTGQKATTLADIEIGRHYNPNCTDFSSDGRWLASGDSNGEVKIWDLKSRKDVLTMDYQKQNLLSVRFTPDETKLLLATNIGVRIRELPDDLK